MYTRGRKNVPECGDPSVTLRVPAPLSGEPFPLLLWKASPERGGGPLAVEGSSTSQGNFIGPKKLLTDGTLTLEKIAECVGLSLEEVKKIQAGQRA